MYRGGGKKIRVCKRSAAMKAPVGLLSDGAVLRSKMEGLCPDKFRHDAQNADNARKNTAFPPVCKKCAKVCRAPENGKYHDESCDSSWDFGALEGTRIPGPLIKRAYFDGFLYPNSLQNARFDDIFSQLRPVSAPHAFSSCRIFVALFCGTITGTFFISYDKQDFCSHNFGRMGLHGLAALERAFSGGHPALFPDAAPIKISPE